jgi:hypothetical protein
MLDVYTTLDKFCQAQVGYQFVPAPVYIRGASSIRYSSSVLCRTVQRWNHVKSKIAPKTHLKSSARALGLGGGGRESVQASSDTR